jgi:CheY-like chemotaxis protein
MRNLLCADIEFYDVIYSKIPSRNPDIKMDFVSDGEQALLKLSQNKYDLFITTVIMPRMDGIETIDKVQANPKIYGTPKIAILTGLGGDKFMEYVSKRKVDFIDRYDRKLEEILFEVDQFLKLEKSM